MRTPIPMPHESACVTYDFRALYLSGQIWLYCVYRKIKRLSCGVFYFSIFARSGLSVDNKRNFFDAKLFHLSVKFLTPKTSIFATRREFLEGELFPRLEVGVLPLLSSAHYS